MIDYFPLGVSFGEAFCNRKEELSHLKKNIQLVKPTLIMSPRRYGKTSLVLRSLVENAIAYTHVDLYKEVSEEGIESAIIHGIGDLLGKLESSPKKLLKLASDLFSDTHVKLTLGTEQIGFALEISKSIKTPVDSIFYVLKKLDELAKKRNQIVVLFIDEFQQLAEISKDTAIEAAMREVAQVSKNVVYIFSGSNRHLLEMMFFDRSRPFYKLCDLIKLDRIAHEHYYPYIKKGLKQMTGGVIEDSSIEIILALTENHPYYVNLLCSKLSHKERFSHQVINECWAQCAREGKTQLERELGLLSFNQRKLYIGVAKIGKSKQLSARKTLETIGLTSASLLQSLKVLIEKDYITQDNEGYYKLLDPLYKYIILSDT